MAITWAQALAWRMQQQFFEPDSAEPAGTPPVADVVRRLNAVPANDQRAAELAVAARTRHGKTDAVADAAVDGTIVKVFAFRGSMHYLAADDAGAYLALRAAGRQWELPSWQNFYELTAADWPAFRETVRHALTDGPLTIHELGQAVTSKRRYRNLRPVFDEGAGTLIKPLTWQGDMSFGSPRDGQHTFQLLDGNPHWAGIWDLDDAGTYAIRAYLRGYGPVTYEQLDRWLGKGLSAGGKRLRAWFAALRNEIAEVEIEGESRYVLIEDVETLQAAEPTEAVRLLPGHDQWVMGPGTQDAHVVPPAHRDVVTRKANLVIAGGVVRGSWVTADDEPVLTWFSD